MITRPSHDRGLKIKRMVILIVLALFNTPLFAADPTHHFQLEKPPITRVGQDVNLVFTACRLDGTKIDDASHHLVVYLTNRKETKKQEVSLRRGEGVLQVTFPKPGFQIIQAEDKNNAELTLQDLIEVKP
ncbi:MAG: hypothetical protein LHV69_07495 [Elusimicrobia bacterium]|nr:hypothetical protein [Candidatus Obscuribacterium magneticum]